MAAGFTGWGLRQPRPSVAVYVGRVWSFAGMARGHGVRVAGLEAIPRDPAKPASMRLALKRGHLHQRCNVIFRRVPALAARQGSEMKQVRIGMALALLLVGSGGFAADRT